MSLSVDWFGIAVLAAWGAVSALCALRWFRFTWATLRPTTAC